MVRVLYVRSLNRARNVSAPVAIRRQLAAQVGLRAGVALLIAAALVACAPEPAPRTVLDFMEDGYAREGVLTRCNRNRDETLSNEECANARRAAAAVAIQAERARAAELEQESEAKLLALREQEARRAAAEQDAAAAARIAAEMAYEARWNDPTGPRLAGSESNAAPAFGTPVGAVMPSMSDSLAFDVYAEGNEPLGRPSLEVAAVEPPSNELVIAAPRIEIADLAVIPRPFRDETTAQ
jgi:hypothetical protein